MAHNIMSLIYNLIALLKNNVSEFKESELKIYILSVEVALFSRGHV